MMSPRPLARPVTTGPNSISHQSGGIEGKPHTQRAAEIQAEEIGEQDAQRQQKRRAGEGTQITKLRRLNAGRNRLTSIAAPALAFRNLLVQSGKAHAAAAKPANRSSRL